MPEPKSQIVIYKDRQGKVKIDVRFDGNTVWLNQSHMAELFQKDRKTITEHIGNIFKDGELVEGSVCRKFQHTAVDGKKYVVNFYNLELVIAVGYRVKSPQGTAFRQWATARLSEYVIKGFVIDSERLKNPDLPFDYFEELERTIADIRSSEKKFKEYKQIEAKQDVDFDAEYFLIQE